MIDDIQDRSSFRRNQPCWYLHNDIGLAAINDGLMIESVMYQLLQKHFKGKECYIDLIETFQDVSNNTFLFSFFLIELLYLRKSVSTDQSEDCNGPELRHTFYQFRQNTEPRFIYDESIQFHRQLQNVVLFICLADKHRDALCKYI